jgi:hypothetical protein
MPLARDGASGRTVSTLVGALVSVVLHGVVGVAVWQLPPVGAGVRLGSISTAPERPMYVRLADDGREVATEPPAPAAPEAITPPALADAAKVASPVVEPELAKPRVQLPEVVVRVPASPPEPPEPPEIVAPRLGRDNGLPPTEAWLGSDLQGTQSAFKSLVDQGAAARFPGGPRTVAPTSGGAGSEGRVATTAPAGGASGAASATASSNASGSPSATQSAAQTGAQSDSGATTASREPEAGTPSDAQAPAGPLVDAERAKAAPSAATPGSVAGERERAGVRDVTANPSQDAPKVPADVARTDPTTERAPLAREPNASNERPVNDGRDARTLAERAAREGLPDALERQGPTSAKGSATAAAVEAGAREGTPRVAGAGPGRPDDRTTVNVDGPDGVVLPMARRQEEQKELKAAPVSVAPSEAAAAQVEAPEARPAPVVPLSELFRTTIAGVRRRDDRNARIANERSAIAKGVSPAGATGAQAGAQAGERKTTQQGTQGAAAAGSPGATGSPGPATGAMVAGDPGPKSESESDAASKVVVRGEYRFGEVLVGDGLEIRAVRPRFTLVSRALTAPANPLVRIAFAKDGTVRWAKLLRSSGYVNERDEPILNAVYQWRASGKALRELPDTPGAVLTIEMTIILN